MDGILPYSEAAALRDSAGASVQNAMSALQQNISDEWTRPSVLFRPRLLLAGKLWRASYGGLRAYGESPNEAMLRFDGAWHERRTQY